LGSAGHIDPDAAWPKIHHHVSSSGRATLERRKCARSAELAPITDLVVHVATVTPQNTAVRSPAIARPSERIARQRRVDGRFWGSPGLDALVRIRQVRSLQGVSFRRNLHSWLAEGRADRVVKRNVRILLGKVGLDGHDRGVRMLAAWLRNMRMEVVYIGTHNTPEAAVRAAAQ
jgi:hypothetical protein